jgi:hypothetical protein
MAQRQEAKTMDIAYDVSKIVFMFSCPSISEICVEDVRNLRGLARVSTPIQL